MEWNFYGSILDRFMVTWFLIFISDVITTLFETWWSFPFDNLFALEVIFCLFIGIDSIIFLWILRNSRHMAHTSSLLPVTNYNLIIIKETRNIIFQFKPILMNTGYDSGVTFDS